MAVGRARGRARTSPDPSRSWRQAASGAHRMWRRALERAVAALDLADIPRVEAYRDSIGPR